MNRSKSVSEADESRLLDEQLVDPEGFLHQSLATEEKFTRLRKLKRVGVLAIVLSLVALGFLVIPIGRSVMADAPSASELSQEGWRMWKDRNLLAAEALFEKATNADPFLDDAWNGLGWSQLNQGRAEDALVAFKRCVKIKEDHPAGLNGIGQALLSLGQIEEATKYLELASKTAPAAQFGLLRIYVMQGEFEKAKPIAEKLAGQNGSLPEDTRKLIEAAKTGIVPTELADQWKLPTPSDATSVEGWKLLSSGKPEKAEDTFRDILKQNAEDANALNGLGFSLLNSGKPTEAKPVFEQLLRAQPNHLGALNGLARSEYEAGNKETGIEIWKKLQDLAPEPNAATVGLATHYMAIEDYVAAIPLLETLAEQPRFRAMLEKAKSKLK